jgi:hypothetical protein
MAVGVEREDLYGCFCWLGFVNPSSSVPDGSCLLQRPGWNFRLGLGN